MVAFVSAFAQPQNGKRGFKSFAREQRLKPMRIQCFLTLCHSYPLRILSRRKSENLSVLRSSLCAYNHDLLSKMTINFIKMMLFGLLVSLAFAAPALAKERLAGKVFEANEQNFSERLQISASPLIDGNRATFIFRGKAKTVELVGEMTGWRRSIKLKKLGEKNLFYLSLRFFSDARLEYKFIVDGQWRLDPLNANKSDNGIGGENNFFVMPDYQANTWAQQQVNIRQGRVEDISAMFATGQSQRQVRVYLPPEYDTSNQRYASVYFSDGIEYLEKAKAKIIADNLLEAQKIQPLILVFIAPNNRLKEYWMNKVYVDYLVNEVVNKIDGKYRTIPQAEARAIAGASLGGLIAAYAASLRPDIFANVFGQSASFLLNHGRMIEKIAKSPKKKIRWYLEVGRYEELLSSNRKMRALLTSKRYVLKYTEWSAGHNWTHWSAALADGLSYLFPQRRIEKNFSSKS
jgi:enterochelin esterase family protein